MAKTIPTPPVASSTARAVTASLRPSSRKNLHAHHAAVLQQEVAGKSKFAKMNIAQCSGVLIEGPSNLASGRVAVGMKHPVARVRALSREGQLSRAVAIEAYAPIEQLQNPRWSFCHQRARRVFVHQPRACGQRIAQVDLGGVIWSQCNRDAALGILCIGFGKFAFGQAEHCSVLIQLNRGP